MDMNEIEVISRIELYGHLIERLGTSSGFYYLVDKVPVTSNIELECLSDDEKMRIIIAAMHIWHPEFTITYAFGKYVCVGCASPYETCDKHIRLHSATVHYRSDLIPDEKEAFRSAVRIAETFELSSMKVWYENEELSIIPVEQNIWTKDMQSVFHNVKGDLSCKIF